MVVVRRYLSEHYDTGTLHELAAQIGYTPSSLSRMIKKYSGTTFKEIQTKQRMRVAMNQLSHTALPVSEIALSVGYENQNFFSFVYLLDRYFSYKNSSGRITPKSFAR